MGTQEIVVTKNSNIAFNNSPFFATLTGTQGFYIESSNDGAFFIWYGKWRCSIFVFVDDASPEGVTTATIGSMCFVQDAGVGKMYLKKQEVVIQDGYKSQQTIFIMQMEQLLITLEMSQLQKPLTL